MSTEQTRREWLDGLKVGDMIRCKATGEHKIIDNVMRSITCDMLVVSGKWEIVLRKGASDAG